MKRTFRIGLIVAVLAAAGAPTAWAACTLDSQPVWHGFGGWFGNCLDTNPVSGYVYLLSSPSTVNSGLQGTGTQAVPGLVCNQAGVQNVALQTCQAESGTAGDGQVTIFYDFGIGNPGSVGCPNQAQQPGAPLGIQVFCNDGASLLMNLGFDAGSQQYLIEYGMQMDGSPLLAGFQNGPVLTSVGAGPSPSATNICVNVPAPTVRGDCDEGTNGFGITCLPTDTRPVYGRGRLFTTQAPCGSSPDARLVAGWALAAAQPDAAGNACNIVDNPTTPGMCAFLGATAMVGAIETPAVAGWLQVQAQGAANDKVKIDNAAFDQGRLIVAFSTTNETSIVGFNVYSGATKLNGNLITAKGAGSNAYSFEVGRGALKGGKSVLVEAVKSNGSVEKTAPVTLK